MLRSRTERASRRVEGIRVKADGSIARPRRDPPEDEKKMTAMVESMQVRDSLRMYNGLVEKCFSTCVQSFRRKDLEKDEERVRLPP